MSIRNFSWMHYAGKSLIFIDFHLFNSILWGEKQSFGPALALPRNQREKLSYVTLHRRQKTFKWAAYHTLVRQPGFTPWIRTSVLGKPCHETHRETHRARTCSRSWDQAAQRKCNSSVRKEAWGFESIIRFSTACYYRGNDTTGHCDLSEENSLVIGVELDLIKMKQCLISLSQTKENTKLMWSALLPSCVWKESNELTIDSTLGGKYPQMKQKCVECKPPVLNALKYDFAFDFFPHWDHAEPIYRKREQGVCMS